MTPEQDEARRRERRWLMWQVEEILQREAEREVLESTQALADRVDDIVRRGEAIQKLRAKKGKTISTATQAVLRDLHDHVAALRDLVAAGGRP